MCACEDATQPSAITRLHRKARKSHRCDECRIEIKAGEQYLYVSGIWEGGPNSHHICAACEILMAHVDSETGCSPPLSMLLECAVESANEALLEARWKARKGGE